MQEFQAELSLGFLEGGLIVWHFSSCVSYIAEIQCQMLGATLLKTQEDLKIGIHEMQHNCFVDWNMAEKQI